MKRGLIISGGGAMGAYGVGTLAALNQDYDIVAGISTGALMGGLVALKEFKLLKEAYTSVTQKDIFDKKFFRPSVFKKNGEINEAAILYVLMMRFFGRKETLNTLSTTNQLRNTIDKFFKEEQFKKLKQLNKEIIVGAVNINALPSKVEYFSSLTTEFEDFKDWVWCSANAPFVMSLHKKPWFDVEDQRWYIGEWTDGGLNELAPFHKVLESGCDKVDIILHRERPKHTKQRPFVQDFIHNVERTIDSMRYDIEFKDGNLIKQIDEFAKEKGIKVRVFWLPRKITTNSLMFDKQVMLNWYYEGYRTAKSESRIQYLGLK